jgi:hypothetical protein
MNKEFVPYEEALVLKELGFNEPCLTQSKHKKLCSNKEQPGGCQLHNLHCAYPDCTIDKTVESIQLPLYQQAFRWLYKQLGRDGFGVMPIDIDKCNEELRKLIEIVKEIK